ncbi:MAG: TRAP transporter small permease subunit [Thalassobaculum sp.]|uniref:TRAP transporter small permease subunit n=1 Tax=Thalassobaculum sp. TaxID=2022740 RepID=UPI0032EB1906
MATMEPASRYPSKGGFPGPGFTRAVGWMIVGLTAAFLINTYLSIWHGWPGAQSAFSKGGLGIVQAALFVAGVVGPVLFVSRTDRGLRQDSQLLSSVVAYIVRAAFWAVVLIGLADMLISFLRVENLLVTMVGHELATELGRSQFRGPVIHMPLLVLAMAIAAWTRTIGFQWLALLVVVAELLIVLTRFIYSYEQAFQGDLVRFWYAGLFLFASAYTLYEDGHVRVDVLYSGFSPRAKGISNALGCLFMGVTLCSVILVFGMFDKTSVITGPLLSYEVSQSGFGMYVKYLMAGFLGIFAVTMMIQFAGYLMDSVADMRGEPGHRDTESPMS